MYAFITLLLCSPRTRGSLTATGMASTPCMCGGLFPKMSSNGVSIHSVQWSSGVPSSKARYPALMLLLASNIVIVASIGTSFSVRSKVVIELMCG